MALLRDNPRLSPDKLGKFTPALVKTSGDFFVVNVVYEGWDIHGNPVGKSAQCGLRFSSGVWIAISVPKTPEYGR